MTAAKILAERLRDWGSETYELQPLEIPDAMRDMRAAADLIERQAAELAALRAELEVAESALLRKGYRKTCDIAACNCGSQWNHGGHAEQRLSEIGEALRGAGFNGGTLLGNIETVCAERVALRADAERLRIRGEAYEAAFHIAYRATYQSHSGHWDRTMQGGAGCPECIKAREARAECDKVLREGLQRLTDAAKEQR